MPSTENQTDTRSRELLAAIYGEGEALGPQEASEFEATRDLLSDFVNEPADPASRLRLRGAIERELRERPGGGTKASPLREVLWIRSEGRTALIPSDRPIALAPGSHVVVPRGGRTLVTFADGSEFLLAENTRMALPTTQAKDVVAVLEEGRLYAWVSSRPHRVFAVSTPHGEVRVHGTEFDVNLQRPDQLDLTVASGRVEFAPARDGGKSLFLARRDALAATRAGELTERLSAGELRRRVEWSRAGRGNGRLLLGITAGTLILGASILLATRSRPEVVPEPVIPSAPLQDEGSVTSSPEAWAASMIGSSVESKCRINVLVEGRKGGRWVPENRFVATSQLANSRPDGSRELQVVYEDSVRLNEDGSVAAPSPGDMMHSVKGLTITGRIAADGSPRNLRVAGSATPTGREAIQLLHFLLYNPLFLLPPTPAVEGATWQRPLVGSVPELPGVSLNIQRTVRREAGIEDQGQRLDRYTLAIEGTFGNIEVDNRVVSQVRSTATIKDCSLRSRGELLSEAGSSRIRRLVIQQEELLQLTRTLTPPGGKPVESTLPRISEVSRTTITYDWTPSETAP